MQERTVQRRALVVGASSAIGQAVCVRYLEAGWQVVGHFAHDDEALNSLASSHAALSTVQCDLSDLQAAAALGEQHRDADAVVFLAALATPTSLEALDLGLLADTINVGALSNYAIISQLGPAMAERGWGRIAIGSSIGVKFGGGHDSFAYALANHASEFLPRSTQDWARHGVLANVVRIGVTDTALHQAFPGRDLSARSELIPAGRPATVGEVADFIFWHGSEANSFVTGQVTAISGGE